MSALCGIISIFIESILISRGSGKKEIFTFALAARVNKLRRGDFYKRVIYGRIRHEKGLFSNY